MATPFVGFALAYAKRGWRVFPLHGIRKGKCSCGKNDCHSPGKHPRTKNGVKDATTDWNQIKQWWTKWPDANIGIATGGDGPKVLDIDPRNGGDASYKLLIEENGEINTLSVGTGGGGEHKYFFSDENLPCARGALPRGIDFKGDGGYVVAPPSLHISGSPYVWLTDFSKTPIAKLPEWLIEILSQNSKSDESSQPPIDVASLTPDKRNDATRYYLNKFIAEAVPGVRHEACKKFCIQLSTLLDFKEALPWVSEFVRLIPQDPPFRLHEAEEILEWAYKTKPVSRPAIPGGADPADGARYPYEWNDLGMARCFYDKYKDDICYVIEERSWYFWNGMQWQTGKEHLVSPKLHDILDSLIEDNDCIDEKEKKAFIKFLLSCGNAGRIDAILRVAETLMHVPLSRFNSNPYLVNFLNGTVDLATGELRDHSREDYVSMCISYKIEKQETPQWDAFITFISQNDEKFFHYIYRCLGYSLSGLATEQCAFFLFGPALNGKSTLIETLIDLFGPYAASASASLLAKRQQKQDNNPELASLRGKRFVGVPEGIGSGIDEELFKAIVAGDTVKTCQKYQLPIEFRPTFKLFFSSNVKPAVSTNDLGFWRKVHEWPILQQVEKPDKLLKEKLLAEAPGILFKIIQGYGGYKKVGSLFPPPNVQEATAEHREEASDLAYFVANFITRTGAEDDIAECTEVFKAYVGWSKAKITQTSFGRRMSSEYGFKKIRFGHERHRVYVGIRLLMLENSQVSSDDKISSDFGDLYEN